MIDNFLKSPKFKIITILMVSGITALTFWSLRKKELTPALYQSNCAIINEKNEKLFEISGQLCEFLPDGKSLVFQKDAGDVKETLFLYDNHQNVIWQKKMDLHHVLKLSTDKTRIFTLSYESHQYNGAPFLFDVINILDLKGNITHSWSTFKNKDNTSVACSSYPRTFNDSDLPGIKEFTHLNSLYEIPENELSKKYSWMKKGNLIVNMLGFNVYGIFDPELKLLHTIPYAKDCFGISHDAQILPNGNLLVFRNLYQFGLELSDVVEMNIETSEILRKIEVPYSSIRGSVQQLRDNQLLITESQNGGRAFIVDQNGAVVMDMMNPINDTTTNKPVVFQVFRKSDELQEFLDKQLQ